jgi:hypothetical protein
MVSLNIIRAEFKAKLAINPLGLSMDDLNLICDRLIDDISDEDKLLFARFKFWMRYPKTDEPIVCANVELVRFSVLSARPPQKSKKDQNSGISGNLSSLVHPAVLAKFFKTHGIASLTINRRPDTVESRAKIVDACVKQSLATGTIVLPEPDKIEEESNKGNKRPQSMQYITIDNLLKCIARSENASSLTEYAMQVIAAMEIYNQELHEAKTNALLNLQTELSKKDDVISERNDKIDNLENLLKKQHEESQLQLRLQREESQLHHEENQRKMDALMIYAEDTNEKLTIIFDFTVEFAKMILPMWNGSSVFKTQMDNLTESRSIIMALSLLKVMFVVPFYGYYERPYNTFKHDDKDVDIRTTIKIYFCCCNFGEIRERVSKLSSRHKNDMYMMQPIAIGLISSEINTEKMILEKMHIFPAKAKVEFKRANKAFDIHINETSIKDINNMCSQIVSNTLTESFQGYQIRMNGVASDINQNIITHLTNADDQFYSDVRPYCQMYLDCFYKEVRVKGKLVEYKYCTSSKATSIRPDIGNRKLTNAHYALYKIKEILDEDRGIKEIDNMVHTGVISKRNIKSLKKVAEVEHVDITNVQFPDNSSDSE